MSTTDDRDGLEQLKDWNPMKDAYHDSQFNTYMTGPGADLEDNLQPSRLTSKQIQAYLVFSNVPANLSVNGLLNICSQYGRAVRGSQKDNLIFINFASINDMERVFTGLQDNAYGFKVRLGNKVTRDPRSRELPRKESENSAPPIPFANDFIDYERSYQTSSTKPPRPRLTQKPLVSKEDYENSNSQLSVIDPQRHYLIEEDAHDLERLSSNEQNRVEDGKFNFYTGRAYYVMSKDDQLFIEEKCKASAGSYDSSQEKFTKYSSISEGVKTAPCKSCRKACDTICSRCSVFFCSTECQTKEWKRHRYVCGKPPGFVPFRPEDDKNDSTQDSDSQSVEENEPEDTNHHLDSKKEAALEVKFPSNGDTVTITAISKTNVVFVRSKAYADKVNFFNTVSAIQKEAPLQPNIQYTPHKGDIVFTLFKADQYNRAMILNADDLEKIRLIYIDYGNIDVKSVDDLLDAPDHFWHLPRIAAPIILKDVPDFYMTEEVKTLMYDHLNRDMKITFKAEDAINGIQQAELFDLTSNKSFNTMIIETRDFDKEENKDAVVFKEHLESKPLPSGENIKLIVMDSSLIHTAFISCTTEAYAYEIEKFQRDIQAYVALKANETSYTPRVREMCIVKYDVDGLWYRGRCLELVGDGHPTILFVDYGNVVIVSMENIRKYPEQFTFPILTGDCEIYGLPEEISPELKEKLENELTPGTELICEKVEHFPEDGTYALHLDSLLKRVLD